MVKGKEELKKRSSEPADGPDRQNQHRNSEQQSRPKKSDQQKKPKTVEQSQPRSRGQDQPRSSKQISPEAPPRDKRMKHFNRLGNIRQFLFVANIALTYINVGASLTWAVPLLYEAKKHGIDGHEFTRMQATLIASLMFVTMLITPLPAGILCDNIGRKWALIIAGSLSCVSWLLVVFISDIGMLYSSRVMAGFFAGAVLTIVPMYIAEIARPEIRGTLAAINPVMFLCGSELTFILGPNVSLKVMAITCGVMPHVFLILMFFMPESPHWLIYKKKHNKAQENFEWFRGMPISRSVDLQSEYREIVKYVETDFPNQWNFKSLCRTRANRRALMIVEVLMALQRLTGITALTGYTTVTIPDRNIGSLRVTDVITVLGFIWLLSTVLALLLIDKVGRVPLLVISCMGCFLANVSCGTWFFVNRHNLDAPNTLAAHWFPFAAISVNGAFYIIGIGSIPSVLQGEMFSSSNRVYASAVTVMIMSATSGLINVIYFPIADAWGFYVNFSFYAIICLLTLTFVLAVVPETKGKSLYAIQEELNEQF